MKGDPSLNKNYDTALYGMTGAIPDKRLLREFICMHQSAMLDTIGNEDDESTQEDIPTESN